MRKTSTDPHRRFYIAAAVVLYVVWIVVIELVGRFAATLPTIELTTALDRQTPLIPEMVWIYAICYFFPLLPLFVAKDWHRFNRGLLAMLIANAVALVMYLLVPVYVARPALGDSFSERVLQFIYDTDYQPSANKLPSLHVVFAWLVYFMCLRQRLPRWAEGVILGLAIVISLSTLFVKQHILYDVISGTLWAMAAWWLAGKLYDRLRRPEWEGPTAAKRVLRRLVPALLVYAAILLILVRVVPIF